MNEKLLAEINKTSEIQRSLFYCSEKNPFKCTEELFELLSSVIEKKKPFSMVRLGDGEGRILAYPKLFDKEVFVNQVLTYQFGSGVIETLKKEFGQDYISASMLTLQKLVTDAISNADVVGAPSWLHFRANVDKSNIIAQAAQAVCLDKVTQLCSSNIPIFDHFIFKPFNVDGYFKKLLEPVASITVISHTDMSQKIEQHFNLQKSLHIKIPGHQSFMKSNEFHFPSVYKNIVNNINVQNEGDIYFVAAGYLGKHYCDSVKKKGGIAIDIGSIFDGWSGIGRPDATKNTLQRI